ncbi:mechanosensitive ion channel family protein [Oleispirillum naphthae]|uniref:mechanosensitive ion channel family protein n=1 Tax=Oleispirillum naphthae TaxID=2838853 RepID=UPI00308222A0
MTWERFFSLDWGGLPAGEIIASVALVVAVALGRSLFEHTLRRREQFISEKHWRILARVKNAAFLLIVVGLFLIWAPSLKTFALSLTAFAVAIIIATKELIMCLSGGVVRVVSNSARVGDWVEIGGVRGQVVNMDLLTVTLQEIHSDGRSYEFTGRLVSIPNAVFLTAPVRNETFYGRYVYHKFTLTFEPGAEIDAMEKLVRDSLERDMEPHMELARRYNATIERKAGLDLQDVEPEIIFETTNEAKIRMNVSAFLPTRNAIRFEQNAVRAALGHLSAAADEGRA